MKTCLTKSVILSSSLLLALVTFSGCGKDKEVKSNPPTAQTVPSPQAELQVGQQEEGSQAGEVAPQANQQPEPQVNPQLGSQTNPHLPPLQQNPGGGLTELEPLPPLPGGTLTPTQTQNNGGTRGGRGGQPLPGLGAQQPPDPQTLPGLQPLPPLNEKRVQDMLRAHQVDFSKALPIHTGGASPEGLYTSVGHDGLMEEFKQYNLKVQAKQQSMNTNLARAIVNAKLARATSSGQMSLTLTINEFGSLQTYKMNAIPDGEKMNLSLSRSGTTGEMAFQGGFVKCLDLDSGCSVAYAKIKIEGGYTRVIFRNTSADLHFLIQEFVTGNRAFSTMSNYIMNAVSNISAANKIEGMKLSSFEVINGRAGVGAMLTTLDRQVVGFNIPMVTNGMGADANINVAKNADLSKNYDLVNLTKSYSVELSRSINQVRLVKNDGRGDFKLQLMFGTDEAPASIWLVAASMQKKIMSLEQIRSFEARVQAF